MKEILERYLGHAPSEFKAEFERLQAIETVQRRLIARALELEGENSDDAAVRVAREAIRRESNAFASQSGRIRELRSEERTLRDSCALLRETERQLRDVVEGLSAEVLELGLGDRIPRLLERASRILLAESVTEEQRAVAETCLSAAKEHRLAVQHFCAERDRST
jgi:hypothetical protein